MKLRLRSFESKETHKIEVPNTFNLQQLKEFFFLQLFPSSSSALQHQNLLLSLNRKEELCGSSPEDSIQSLGVTSGDLIYYSTNPFAFSSQIPNSSGNSRETRVNIEEFNELVNTQKVDSGKLDELDVPSVEFRDLNDAQVEGTSNLTNPNDTGNLENTQMIEFSKVDELIGSSARTREIVDAQLEGSSNLNDPNVENSIDLVEEIDGMEVDDESESDGNYRFSVPSFLKKVYVKEVGDAAANGDHKLLVIAVHAVLLESGFVAYDSVSHRKVEGFHLADVWPSLAFGMTLHYTLPEVSTSEVVETVVLNFQSMGKFVNIYGSLPKKGFGVHRVCLDEPRFLPALSFIWKRGDDSRSHDEMDDSKKLSPNQEIFEFWKIVKDGLSYPLLIDLCERVGVVPPPCFMRLPTELKLKILESLPAVDVAKVECVCSELRFVASNNDLWKLKYEEEFGNTALSQRERQWKAKFSSVWEIRKRRKKICRPLQFREPPHFRPLFPGRRDPNLLGSPFIIGGDYDHLPTFGLPQHPGRRTFRRNYDLGGFCL
ncbi:putative F-box protein At1g23770 [Chenopodium quinoa]|uniref:putative F-box protein At1g23770 n=1 Tax=Chenopodium quinoa TaxID=63459 RepID=UPI000B783088|nr:putative F-box protein At1g23770 [Chenopodium quinoa]